ncbi:S49 family peptidase [Chlorobium sp. N1]|uniref:S49 family peptidase n=1 Tax=Chlorobium sp. N1 TaxID=2491138 RepID=UPI00103DA7C6|nr:S49 family peptidase [Chlorobium sp. N1]TCD48757.1 signal peptide peptidase SppA [Chlorobium sp. N1]
MKTIRKKSGCLRRGCLFTLLVTLVGLVLIFWLSHRGRSLPDRFVLSVPLSGSFEERASPSSSLPFAGAEGPLSLQELLFMFEQASADPRIETVLLDIGGVRTTPSKVAELRSAIERMREGGRKVVAFLRSPEDSDVMLGAACDSVVVEEGGFMLLDGLRAETLYYATPLGKIGVSFQAAQWKRYKSGIEPFVRTGPSPEAREEIGALLDEVYRDYIGYVSKRRGLEPDSLRSVIDDVTLMTSREAVRRGLADGVASSWRLRRDLERRLSGKEPEAESGFIVDADRYRSAMEWPVKSDTKERLALITLSGPIVRTAGEEALGMGSGVDVDAVRSSLRGALADSRVKAMVLRIDSPGGDALASAEMLEMLDSAAVKKPLVVSMSGVAASGGYMAALAGRSIYAEPLSITGSIGVYALKPEISGLVEKIGLGRDVVTRGRNADANSIYKPLDREAYGKFVEASGEVYRDFVGKVARSRRMNPARVDSLAGGRVWTGRRALEVGLVDREGGLFDALREARRLGGIDSTRRPGIVSYPSEKSWLELLMQGDFSRIASRAEGELASRAARRFMQGASPLPAALYPMLRGDRAFEVLTVMPCDIVIR